MGNASRCTINGGNPASITILLCPQGGVGLDRSPDAERSHHFLPRFMLDLARLLASPHQRPLEGKGDSTAHPERSRQA
jgi:hypothetical protein